MAGRQRERGNLGGGQNLQSKGRGSPPLSKRLTGEISGLGDLDGLFVLPQSVNVAERGGVEHSRFLQLHSGCY